MGFGNEVANVLKVMRHEKEVYKDYLPPEAQKMGERIYEVTKGLWDDVLDEVIELIKSEIPEEYPHVAVWWYSVLVNMKKDPILFLEFVRYIRKNQHTFSGNTNYYLFYQLKRMAFCFVQLQQPEISVEIWKYFHDTVEQFAKDIDESLLEKIPFEDRNADKIVVITEQILDIRHGPTKTTLDRCKCIMEKLGKEVLLISTAEIVSIEGEIPFCQEMYGVSDPGKRQEQYQQWKGTVIPFFQCEDCMPDRKQITMLLRKIREMAPQYVVAIGGSGMLCNLVNKMIPVLTVGLCPSDFEFTTTQFQTLGRKIKDSDREILKAVGYTEDRVIESIFTSSLKPQSEVTSRRELGLPEDKFLMVTVGMRLDDEITDTFMEMLEEAMLPEMYWVIIGAFDYYEEYLSRHPKLKRQTIYLGTCQDILSRMEVCDLYVNPTRRGGGTSSVEALFKGVPVVSVDYGDVAVNVGEEFCVKDYGEMKERIIHYGTDKCYYDCMHKKALQRSEKLLDTDGEFTKIMQEVKRRELGMRGQEKNERL